MSLTGLVVTGFISNCVSEIYIIGTTSTTSMVGTHDILKDFLLNRLKNNSKRKRERESPLMISRYIVFLNKIIVQAPPSTGTVDPPIYRTFWKFIFLYVPVPQYRIVWSSKS